MTNKRFNEEGIAYEQAGPPAKDDGPVEPEKLVIPAGAVNQLLVWALQSPQGNAWFQGFVTAYGEPSWIVAGQWGVQAKAAEIIKAPPPNGQVRR